MPLSDSIRFIGISFYWNCIRIKIIKFYKYMHNRSGIILIICRLPFYINQW